MLKAANHWYALSHCLQGMPFGSLFTRALHDLGILSIGIYRLIDPRPSAGSYNRYVITNPSSEFDLYPSDKVRVCVM